MVIQNFLPVLIIRAEKKCSSVQHTDFVHYSRDNTTGMYI